MQSPSANLVTKTACWVLYLGLFSFPAPAQVTLSGTNYLENFDSLGLGLPAGWNIYTNATLSDLGTTALFNPATVSWANTSGGFKNYASANNPGASAGDSLAIQAGYLDRALGMRQTANLGDPGAALVLTLANTLGCGAFKLSLDFQSLSVQSRSTTWTIDYRLGNSGDFHPLGSFSDPGSFGSFTQSYDFGPELNDQSLPVTLRVVALNPSTGSGNRDSIGIDNLRLSYSAIPEPAGIGIGLGLAMFAWIAVLRWRSNKGHHLHL